MLEQKFEADDITNLEQFSNLLDGLPNHVLVWFYYYTNQTTPKDFKLSYDDFLKLFFTVDFHSDFANFCNFKESFYIKALLENPNTDVLDILQRAGWGVAETKAFEFLKAKCLVHKIGEKTYCILQDANLLCKLVKQAEAQLEIQKASILEVVRDFLQEHYKNPITVKISKNRGIFSLSVSDGVVKDFYDIQNLFDFGFDKNWL